MEQKVVLITGCTAGGIGHALAAEFAARGCVVFATARRVEAMTGLVDLGCALLPLDVTDPNSVFAAVEQVLQQAGRIDILVNNAGLGGRGPVCEYDLGAARRVFEVNVFGTLAMTQAVVPHMLQRRSGTVINIGSALGLLTLPFTGIYSASKRAVGGLTDALRRELCGSGVHAVYVAPGWVRSNISESSTHGDLNQMDPKGPWAACARHITGDLFANEGAHAVAPKAFAKGFCDMVLRPSPPTFWTNSARDGWLALLLEKFVPPFILDLILALRAEVPKAFPPMGRNPMGVM